MAVRARKLPTTRIKRTKPYRRSCIFLPTDDNTDATYFFNDKEADATYFPNEKRKRPVKRKKISTPIKNDPAEQNRLLEEASNRKILLTVDLLQFGAAEDFELCVEYAKPDYYVFNGRKILDNSGVDSARSSFTASVVEPQSTLTELTANEIQQSKNATRSEQSHQTAQSLTLSSKAIEPTVETAMELSDTTILQPSTSSLPNLQLLNTTAAIAQSQKNLSKRRTTRTSRRAATGVELSIPPLSELSNGCLQSIEDPTAFEPRLPNDQSVFMATGIEQSCATGIELSNTNLMQPSNSIIDDRLSEVSTAIEKSCFSQSIRDTISYSSSNNVEPMELSEEKVGSSIASEMPTAQSTSQSFNISRARTKSTTIRSIQRVTTAIEPTIYELSEDSVEEIEVPDTSNALKELSASFATGIEPTIVTTAFESSNQPFQQPSTSSVQTHYTSDISIALNRTKDISSRSRTIRTSRRAATGVELSMPPLDKSSNSYVQPSKTATTSKLLPPNDQSVSLATGIEQSCTTGIELTNKTLQQPSTSVFETALEMTCKNVTRLQDVEPTFRLHTRYPLFDVSNESTGIERTFNLELNSLTRLLRICEQDSVYNFNEFIQRFNENGFSKLGEGTHAEVFRAQTKNRQQVALKVVPFTTGDIVEMNSDSMKTCAGVQSEAIISKQLSEWLDPDVNRTDSFVRLVKMRVVKGLYPATLLKAWQIYKDSHDEEEAYNENPENYCTSDQHYLLMVMTLGGQCLESFVPKNTDQAISILLQTIYALHVAERVYEFEHRDLHVGNVLIKTVPSQQTSTHFVDGKKIVLRSHGVKVTIIDFTLSRSKSCEFGTVCCNLEEDEDLFKGDGEKKKNGDYQFDIYRKMREACDCCLIVLEIEVCRRMSNENKVPEPEYHRKFGRRSTPLEVLENIDISDKIILITGTTQGIGLETVRALALRGARVVMANRSIVRAEAVRDAIYKETEHRKIDLIHMDLSSLQSVQAAAEEFLKMNIPLHVLILNAGVMAPTNPISIDGYENTFATNHLGHFYLVHLLRSKLIESAPSRVVVVSSHSHKHTMINSNAPLETKMEKLVPDPNSRSAAYLLYAYSKMCNVLFAMKLYRELNDKHVNVYVLHPGSLIPTAIGRSYGIFNRIASYFTKPFAKTISQGATTVVFCAVSPDVEQRSGRYFDDCWDDESQLNSALAHDQNLQDALWDRSLAYVKKYEDSRISNA
ncbi:WW domain-containing oxidoreductase [Aphelenchoides besseyi]|nr:WW domain-containing oxidoreductase [Aphelenchoides besseyi]